MPNKSLSAFRVLNQAHRASLFSLSGLVVRRRGGSHIAHSLERIAPQTERAPSRPDQPSRNPFHIAQSISAIIFIYLHRDGTGAARGGLETTVRRDADARF